MKKNPILIGTLILTLTGFITRIIGFFYRIYLSHAIGAEGMGIYQMIFPISGICFALCAGSVQTAISRFVAADDGMGIKGREKSILHSGLLISLSIALVLNLLIYKYARELSVYVLLEARCESLLRIMSFSIPLSAIHACICGYYYGLKRTNVPAFSQLIEQIIRVFAVYLIADILKSKGMEITVSLAVFGALAGEAASTLFTLISIGLSEHIPKVGAYFFSFRQIIGMALPLTANRLLLNILQSAEAIMIPFKLQAFGMADSQALSIYGILTGMALPFILFPSAITNSVAVMLLPSIAEAQSGGNDKKISRTTSTTLRYCLYMGILCTGIFIIFGDSLGKTVYNNETAGDFIRILAWLCPFLYLSTTMGSILNGLGKTTTTFIQNMIAMTVRLLFVVFGIPKYGIIAYLWGVLVSQLIIALLHIISIHKITKLTLNAWAMIVKPIFCLAISAGILSAANYYFKMQNFNPMLQLGLDGLVLCSAYCLMLMCFHRFDKNEV